MVVGRVLKVDDDDDDGDTSSFSLVELWKKLSLISLGRPMPRGSKASTCSLFTLTSCLISSTMSSDL